MTRNGIVVNVVMYEVVESSSSSNSNEVVK
jgi:hypothetical protein